MDILSFCLPGRHLLPLVVITVQSPPYLRHPASWLSRCQVPPSIQHMMMGVLIPEKVCHPTPETLALVNTIQFIFSLVLFRWAVIIHSILCLHFHLLFSRGHLISSNLWLCGEKCHQVTQETRTETKASWSSSLMCDIMMDMIHVSLVLLIISLISTFSVSSGTGGLPTSGFTSWCLATPPPGLRASASVGWRPTRRQAAPQSSAIQGARARVCSPSLTPPSPGTVSPSANRPGPATHSLSVSSSTQFFKVSGDNSTKQNYLFFLFM